MNNVYHNDFDGYPNKLNINATDDKSLIISKAMRCYLDHHDNDYEMHVNDWLDTNAIELLGVNGSNDDSVADELLTLADLHQDHRHHQDIQHADVDQDNCIGKGCEDNMIAQVLLLLKLMTIMTKIAIAMK